MSPLVRLAALLALAVFVVNGSTVIINQIDDGGAIFSDMAANEVVTEVSPVGPVLQLAKLSARAQLASLTFKSKPVILLNVSWENPEGVGLDRPSMYHILVCSMATEDDKYCQPAQYTEKSAIPETVTSYLMPQMLEPLVNGDFKVRPGCTYNVTIFTDIHVHEAWASINYTVPDCVGQICNCKRFSRIAAPEVKEARKLNATLIKVVWTYPPLERDTDGVNLTQFSVVLKTAHGHLTTSMRTILRVPLGLDSARKNTSYVREIALPGTLLTDTSYKVEVTVVDEGRGCHGLPGGKLLEVAGPLKLLPEVSVGSGMWLTVLSSATFVLACTLACTMAWQRCGGWLRRKCIDRNLPPVQWQGIYKAVAPDVPRQRPNFPAMQHSVIYVEKEIEEAKARGDADTLEVGYGRLELGREVGKGAFGRVFLARAECIAGYPGFTNVAVKKLKHKANNDEVEEFLSEIAMLKQVGRHPNIVTLLGCVTIRQPYCMVMEYIPCGDLLQYLRRLRVEYERRTGASLPDMTTRSRPAPRSPRYVELALSSDSDASYVMPEGRRSGSRPSVSVAETEWSLLSNDSSAPLTSAHHSGQDRPQHLEYILDPKELQNFAVQIARGMEHLERKQITHRDLAARNVLIDENKTLKISDFGLSRSGIYVNTKRKKVPLRWLSVEAMRDNLYSSKSDVWAFAIVLWEIGTLGGFPYPTINDFDLLNFLLDGKRLDKPDNCTEELYSLMLVCWSHAADSRPTFGDLVSHLDSVICRRRVYVDFDNLRPDYTFPPTEQLKVATPDEGSTPGDDKEVASVTASTGE